MIFINVIKKNYWFFYIFVITTYVFAEDSICTPGQSIGYDPCYDKTCLLDNKICEKCLPSAKINICRGINAYAIGSFIYWEPLGDELDLGVVQFFTSIEKRIKPIKFKTDYKPGFKVGLGTHFVHDDWYLYAQYTRLYETQKTNFKPDPGEIGNFSSIWYQIDPNNQTLFALSNIPDGVKALWKIKLDKIDLELGRAFYLCTFLSTSPFVGTSFHLIDQSYFSNVTDIRSTSGGGLYKIFYKNDSWAIGPRFGLDAKWLIYKGFRLFGYGAFGLMFSENMLSGHAIEANVSFTGEKIEKSILREIIEMQFGFAWSSYFANYKSHIEVLIAYEAQKYSHSNYMTYYAQQALATLEIKSAYTFFHGLTISARFDF